VTKIVDPDPTHLRAQAEVVQQAVEVARVGTVPIGVVNTSPLSRHAVLAVSR
jgi:hypothetical protein